MGNVKSAQRDNALALGIARGSGTHIRLDVLTRVVSCFFGGVTAHITSSPRDASGCEIGYRVFDAVQPDGFSVVRPVTHRRGAVR